MLRRALSLMDEASLRFVSTTISKADCKIHWEAELRKMDGTFILSSDHIESSSLGMMLALRSRPSNSDVDLREAL